MVQTRRHSCGSLPSASIHSSIHTLAMASLWGRADPCPLSLGQALTLALASGMWGRSDDVPVMRLNLSSPLVFLLAPCHHHGESLP